MILPNFWTISSNLQCNIPVKAQTYLNMNIHIQKAYQKVIFLIEGDVVLVVEFKNIF